MVGRLANMILPHDAGVGAVVFHGRASMYVATIATVAKRLMRCLGSVHPVTRSTIIPTVDTMKNDPKQARMVMMADLFIPPPPP